MHVKILYANWVFALDQFFDRISNLFSFSNALIVSLMEPILTASCRWPVFLFEIEKK